MATATTKRLIFILAVVLVAVAVLWQTSATPDLPPLSEAFPSGEVRVAIDPSYPPFAFYAEDGTLGGLDVELARALADTLGLTVVFVPVSFDGLYDKLATDRADWVIAALIVDGSREREVRYTSPYLDAGLRLITPPSSLVRSLGDLRGETLALELGSEAHNEAQKWRAQTSFVIMPYEYPAYSLDAMRLGLAQFALVDNVALRLYLRQHPQWHINSAPVNHLPMAIAVRADRPLLWTYTERALQALLARGEIARIISRWL
jgi:ABC-type amino acid transport substrate-binding protein